MMLLRHLKEIIDASRLMWRSITIPSTALALLWTVNKDWLGLVALVLEVITWLSARSRRAQRGKQLVWVGRAKVLSLMQHQDSGEQEQLGLACSLKPW